MISPLAVRFCMTSLKLIIGFVTFFVMAKASAVMDPPKGFQPLDQEMARLGWTPAHRQALVEIGNVTSGETQCTGTYVTDSGVILTASHCLDECVFETSKQIVFSKNFFVWTSHLRRGQNQRDLRCRFLINGRSSEVKVRAMSKCAWPAVTSAMIEAKHPQAFCRGEIDLALIEPIEKDPNQRCMNLDTSGSLSLGESVFSIGAPEKTTRTWGGNSSGRGLYVSYGELISSPTCLRENGERVAMDVREMPGYQTRLQTSVDAEKGMSGAPLLRGDRIVGVAHGRLAESTSREACLGASFFEPVSKLKTRLDEAGLSSESFCRVKAL